MVPIASVLALAVAFIFYKQIFSLDKGTPEMQAISDKIEEGAMAYLRQQYKTIGIIAVIVAVVIAVVGLLFEDFEDYLNYKVAIAFVIGAAFSILSGFIGMKVSVNSNIRTASAARGSLDAAFKTSFRGGAISGIAVSLLSLAGLFLVFYVYYIWCDESMTTTLHSVVGYAFGASMAALFAQLGGGIYTKAADVGADLVGKVEAGIPEDDPRNPAVIADLVGDNVGDCAGRGADIFESTAAEIIGAMVIGLAIFNIPLAEFTFGANVANFVFFPLVLIAFGLIASLIGIFCVRLPSEDADVIKALNLGYYITIALVIVALFLTTFLMFGDIENVKWLYFAFAGLVGIALGLIIVYVTQYYTGDHKPVKTIAEQSESGPATNVIMGLSVGLESTVLPVIFIGIALVASFLLGYYAVDGGSSIFGLYGTAVATIAMLASSAFILAEDTFGPITDNAGGIAEMSELPEEVREITDKLDAVGNTTAAIGKGFAIGSAALTALALLVSYSAVSQISAIDLLDPIAVIGLFIGAMLPFLFSALTMNSVGKAANQMIEEVRRQFRADAGIMAGTSKPDYARCVDISTKAALHEMVLPAILAIVAPLAVGILLGAEALGGMLAGAIAAGVLLAIMMANAGGAWDNAKKYVEEGHFGGKGSPTHAAAVIGDTVGDPFKDTSGPSINILIKLMTIVAVVFAPLFVQIGGLLAM